MKIVVASPMMWFFLQEAKDLQKVSRLHPDDVLVFMMYPDGWPLNQHNIVQLDSAQLSSTQLDISARHIS